jgi:hypothetical protein
MKARVEKMDQSNTTQLVIGEINPMIASLIEELPTSGEWTRYERELWGRVFLRTLDELYKV